MLLDIVKKGSTDRSVTIRIIDSSDGTPETGVVFNTSGIDLWYRREGATLTSITEADLSTPALDDAHADGGFLHIDDGYYRLDLPDAAFATGANHVDVGGTVTGMVVIGGRVRLVDYDPEDTVRLGLTSLPNAAADAAGGLPISDAGGLDLDGLNTNVAAILVDTGTTLDGKLDTIDDFLDTEIAAILAAVDTEIASILEDTGTTIPALIGTPTDFGSGTSTLAANLQDLADNGTATFDRATDSLQAIRDRGDAAWTSGAGSGLTPLASGTAQGGTSSTIQLASGETFADDELNGNIVKILSGTGAGQSRLILNYVGSTDTCTVSANWVTSPSSDSVYEIVDGPGLGINFASMNRVTVGSIIAGAITSSSFSSSAITSTAIANNAIGSDQLSTNAVNEIQSGLATAANLATAQADLDILTGSDGATLATSQPNYAPSTHNAAAVVTAMGTGTFLTAIPWNAAWDAEVQSEATDALNAYDPPTRTELSSDISGLDGKLDTIDDFLDTEIAAILAAVDTEVGDILTDTGTALPAQITALLTTAGTEAYRGTGATGSVFELLYEILANLVEFANAGTTRTAKRLDGSTTAKTYTYDSTTPTSITETT